MNDRAYLNNFFFKTLDPILMSGFINRKAWRSYWINSAIGGSSFLIAFIMFYAQYLNNVLKQFYLSNNQGEAMVLSFSQLHEALRGASSELIYASLLGGLIVLVIFSLPFLIDRIFVFHTKSSLAYHYVKFLWLTAKPSILTLVEDLPEQVLSQQERILLYKDTKQDKQIRIILKAWHKNAILPLQQGEKN